MRRLIGLTLCVATVIGTGSAAFAGEINGKGGSTPIGDGTARNSICAYSGLQDGEGPDDPASGPGHVQTPHGEPDYDEYFDPGVASICQWINTGYLGGHSARPQEPPPFEE